MSMQQRIPTRAPLPAAGPEEANPLKLDPLSDTEFHMICELVHTQAGIHLHDGKRSLVEARLGSRLRSLGLRSFSEYLTRLGEDRTQGELIALLDALSTNLTSFWREAAHFDHFARELLPHAAARGARLRFWSAGCSTGEEPYGIAITALETLGRTHRRDLRILATDLSTAVLDAARTGLYTAERMQQVPAPLRERYFERVACGREPRYRPQPCVRELIHFTRLNLMEPWPMKGLFDAIFCRNVMIYFDKPTRERLVARFHGQLRDGGVLYVGHAESLTGLSHAFRYLRPTIYEKAQGAQR